MPTMMRGEALFVVAVVAAFAGTATDVGSWNDAARLATVESLVDRHTWRIDESVLFSRTMDRAYIDGHFYSHRSPLPSLALAAIYQFTQLVMGLNAAKSPGVFCYTLTLLSSGVAYVVAVMSFDRLAVRTGLSAPLRWPLTWSFAFGTIALTYSRAVNDHVFLLAVFALLNLSLWNRAQRAWNDVAIRHLIAIGTLTGVGYSIDLGVGPVLAACVLTYVGAASRRISHLSIVALTAFPWIALHYALTWMIGRTFRPLGAVAEYMTTWPGSPFTVDNLTGLGWAHGSVAGFGVYAIGLLVGPKGFLLHNPVLFFLPASFGIVRRAASPERALAWYSIAVMAGTWLIYAITSNNYAGETASVRWFVPLLAPSYYLLTLALKHRPEMRNEVVLVSLWSIVLGVLLWRRGPWVPSIGLRLWVVNLAALFTWIAYRAKWRPSSR
jgi:hypothetical protein